MTAVWNNPAFAAAWNDTYGLDMARAPIRPGLIYPLLRNRVDWNQGPAIADFGCGNGNLLRALQDQSFSHWTGYDSGSAILATAMPLAQGDKRVALHHADISQPMGALLQSQPANHAISVFTLEEIPSANAQVFFNNLAAAIGERRGTVHIFTQHPAYALQQDLLAKERGIPNSKFDEHEGYFDSSPTTYNLSVLNQQGGVVERAEYHHKPMAAIINGMAKAGLSVVEMLEIPAGTTHLDQIERHRPVSGDVPRFLYIRAKPF